MILQAADEGNTNSNNMRHFRIQTLLDKFIQISEDKVLIFVEFLIRMLYQVSSSLTDLEKHILSVDFCKIVRGIKCLFDNMGRFLMKNDATSK